MAPSPATDRGTCRTGGFSWVQHTCVLLPQEPSSLCPPKVLAPCRPPLTCICEMASSILKRVCRMQEQDDCETVTHCRSHRISSHMHDTCGTPKGPQHQPHWPAAGSLHSVLGTYVCLSVRARLGMGTGTDHLSAGVQFPMPQAPKMPPQPVDAPCHAHPDTSLHLGPRPP